MNPRLHTDEILIALSICAATNPTAELAMAQLKKLRGCEAHATVILSHVDEDTFRRLGVNLTCRAPVPVQKAVSQIKGTRPVKRRPLGGRFFIRRQSKRPAQPQVPPGATS